MAPDTPVVKSTFDIQGQGWSPAARFDGNRLYLTPSSDYWNGTNQNTPVQIYDLLDPLAPKLAGSTTIDGAVWNFIPVGDRLFSIIGGRNNRLRTTSRSLTST